MKNNINEDAIIGLSLGLVFFLMGNFMDKYVFIQIF